VDDKKIRIMNNKLLLILIFISGISVFSQVVVEKSNSFEAIIQVSFEPQIQIDKSFTYKRVDGKELKIHGFFPDDALSKHPCLIFIHGGGWSGGTIQSSLKWCRYLSELGCVAFTIEYRLANESRGIKPSTCLEDTKSAVRWVREQAKEFNIDTGRIALSGTSAGGHLAAACATIDGFNDDKDDLSVSCKPQLLLLSSPVIDNGHEGYGYDRVKDFWGDFSPVHNLNNKLPPTCILLGDKDPLIPLESAVNFGQAVKKSGKAVELYVFEGQGHNLFSQKEGELTEPIMLIYYHWHLFLAQQGYVKKPKKLKSDYSIVLSKYQF
jgi:acetyl esterase